MKGSLGPAVLPYVIMIVLISFLAISVTIIVCFNVVGTFTISARWNHAEKSERVSSKKYVCRQVYFNPNPTASIDEAKGKPEKWNKGDCVIRAFCGVLNLPWDVVYSALCKIGAEHHNLPNASEVYDCYAKKMGFIRVSGQRMNVSEFAASHGGVYFILIKGHAVCVKNHQIYDCSDCGWGRIESCYVKADSMTDDDKPTRTRQTRAYTPSAIELEILEELEKESDNTLEGERASPAFTYYNPNPEACSENKSGKPQNVVKIDNVIRAFSGFLNLSWDEVYTDLCRLGMAQHDMPDSKSVITRYAKEKGLIKKTLKVAVSLSSFARSHDGDYLVQLKMGLSPEMTYVTERKIHDIYNPGSRKVRTYYVKAS